MICIYIYIYLFIYTYDHDHLNICPGSPAKATPNLDAVDRALEELQRGLLEIDHVLAGPLGFWAIVNGYLDIPSGND